MAEESTAPVYSVFFISAAALSYEVLLIRLFSIIQWHHYAQIIISLALLGYGMSGSFLSVFIHHKWLRRPGFYIANLCLFSLLVVACFIIAQNIPFNAEELIWDSRQPLMFVVIFLILSVPFFFAANAIGLSFVLNKQRISHIYAADLIGAGVGSIFIVMVLWMLPPNQALLYCSILGWCAVTVALKEMDKKQMRWLWGVIAILGSISLLLWIDVPLKMSSYKALAQIKLISGTESIKQYTSPLGLIDVMDNNQVPFRHAPGMSINSVAIPPKQIAVFVDGGAMVAIDRINADRRANNYLENTTSALPYLLDDNKRVLIPGIGGGMPVLQAKHFKIRQIDIVESNSQMIKLLTEELLDFTNGIFLENDVNFIHEEIRGYVARTNTAYDLIQLMTTNSFAAASAGLYALSESYSYTVEAFTHYLTRLTNEGKLAITLWNDMPPKKILKIFATAADSLAKLGVKNPGENLLLVRGWQTSTLVIKRNAVSAQDILVTKQFSHNQLIDLAYYPGMPANEANQYNQLRQADYYNAATEILGTNRHDFINAYKYAIAPATDEKPFVDHYFKWGNFMEIMALRHKGGMPLIEWGYLLLVFALVQAVVLAAIFILLPLFVRHLQRKQDRQNDKSKIVKVEKEFTNKILVIQYLLYFSCLGVAFLLVEITFIQKFTLILSYPVYASALVLMTFLLFAGIGSRSSAFFTKRYQNDGIITYSIYSIMILCVIYIFLSDFIVDQLLVQPMALKLLLSVLMIAPLAYCMGIPFPTGLKMLAQVKPDLIPWAWGVNGFGSVISAILATLIAMQFGLSRVIMCAVVIYGIAAIVIRLNKRDSCSQY